MDGFVDVSLPICCRGTYEAHKFKPIQKGLDSQSVNTTIPDYSCARNLLKQRDLMNSDRLARINPFYPKLSFKNSSYANFRAILARGYHFMNKVLYRVFPRKYSYPVVFGYSDIVSIPKSKFDDFCNILEVFSSWQMFVELAIPTAIQLIPDLKVTTNDAIDKATGNVWYPQDPEHFTKTNNIIEDLMTKSSNNIDLLQANFPSEYLYLHPVKLSKLKV